MALRRSSSLGRGSDRGVAETLAGGDSENGKEEGRKRRSAAIEPAAFVNEQKQCVHCHAINNCKFKYMNNASSDQPRYKCLRCRKCFTHGFHGRVTGKTYKKRGEDPEELQGFKKVCPNPKCGVENNAMFLYFNNKSTKGTTQPRYVCNSCKLEFQLFPGKWRKMATLITTSKDREAACTSENASTSGKAKRCKTSSSTSRKVQPATMAHEDSDSFMNSVQDKIACTSGRAFDASQFDVSSAQTENWAQEDFSNYSVQDLDMSVLASSSAVASPFLSCQCTDQWAGEVDSSQVDEIVAFTASGISDHDDANGSLCGSSIEPAAMAEEGCANGVTVNVDECMNVLSATDDLVSYYLNAESSMLSYNYLNAAEPIVLLSPASEQQADSTEELQTEEEDSLEVLLEQALEIAGQSSWGLMDNTTTGLFDQDAAYQDVDDCWKQQLSMGLFT